MKAQIVRKNFSEKSCVSDLLIDGVKVCFILEDKVRDVNMDGDNDDVGEGKVYGHTAIPYTLAGKAEYKIVLEPHGTIHEKYKVKNWAKLGFPGFDKIYQGMLMVIGINGYKRVHIHIGTKIEDTLGCPLTGSNADLRKDPYTVSASTAAYVKLYKKVINYLLEHKFIPLEVIKG